MRLGKDVVEFLDKGVKLANVNVLKMQMLLMHEELERYSLSNWPMVNTFESDAVIVATGYDVFDASKKEEYGYGIYDNVITSAELEEMFLSGKPLLHARAKHRRRLESFIVWVHEMKRWAMYIVLKFAV